MRPLVALFPRLHTFNWRGVRLRPRYLSTLVSFLRGASLRSATVDCRTMGSDLEDIVSSAFKSLSQGFQDLEILEVKGLVDGTLLFPALRDFRSLTTFRCVTASIDEAAGRALASLPQLRTCVIKLPERQSFMRTVDRLRFPCLRDFKVIGTEDAYGRFSRVARCPELIDFTLDVWPIADKDGISRLIQNLRAHLSGSPHLTRLQIVTEAGGVYGGSSATLEEDSIVVWPFHIRMLFELKGLRSLDFSPLLAYHLDNELFASISTAWPLLESLSIGAAPRCFHLSPARVTFQALSILASRCPRLTTVALHLDASKGLSGRGAQIPKEHYAELWADGRPVLSPSKVTTLRLQASPIARPREVAKFLSSVFPDLESVVSLGSVHEDTPERRLTRQSRAKKWSEVRQYLIMMRAGRMHKALGIAEVVRLVCENADYNTLAALARSCRSLHQDAMPYLWSSLHGLAPIIAALPDDRWIIEDDFIRLTGPLLESDWETIIRLAGYVKTLMPPRRLLLFRPTSPLFSEVRLHQDVVLSLVAQNVPGRVVFPRLRSLSQQALQRSHEHFGAFLTMTGPHLVNLQIDNGRTFDQLSGVLETTFSRFTKIQSISIGANVQDQDHDVDWDTVVPIPPAWIVSCPLTHFECHLTLTEGAVGALASVPTLQHATINLPDCRSFPHLDSAGPAFPELISMDLTASASSFIAFAKAVRLFPRLENIALGVHYKPLNDVLAHDFINALCSSLRVQVLDCIHVSAFDTGDQEDVIVLSVDSMVACHPDDFRPLLKFARMREFSFCMPWYFNLDDALLHDVAKAWPKLRSFYLGTDNYCAWPSPPHGPTLAALPPFAMHCPALFDIGFQFDATCFRGSRIPLESELYGALQEVELCSQSEMCWLSVARSPIVQPQAVAGFLSCVFPYLEKVTAVQVPGLAPAAGWEEVSRYLPVFRMVRHHERLKVKKAMRERKGRQPEEEEESSQSEWDIEDEYSTD
ncbi:hypothetical protein C8Q77DRAFT_1059859 [Trametes polyzona]|nr:hypothetical protein C8Q77DRAFT_1059859 [Trametes polyzona]